MFLQAAHCDLHNTRVKYNGKILKLLSKSKIVVSTKSDCGII